MTNLPPAGWHPDPENPNGAMRWWDGAKWTSHVHPVQAVPPAWGGPGNGGPAWGGGPTWTGRPGWGGGGLGGAGQGTFARRNQASLIAIGFATVYVLLELTAHIFILGILPVLMTVRAFQRKEQLAPFAVVAAVIAVAVALFVR
jgi:hypothetical protein